jgi:hypothetical protein
MFYFYNIKKILSIKKRTTNGKTKGHIKYVGTLGEVRHFKIKEMMVTLLV